MFRISNHRNKNVNMNRNMNINKNSELLYVICKICKVNTKFILQSKSNGLPKTRGWMNEKCERVLAKICSHWI
jgi:hypothetical protein